MINEWDSNLHLAIGRNNLVKMTAENLPDNESSFKMEWRQAILAQCRYLWVIKGHWGLKGHFDKTSIIAIFSDSQMMGAISMPFWVIDTMFSQKNHVLFQLFSNI